MEPAAGDDFDARLAALAVRIDVALARVSAWVEPLLHVAEAAAPASASPAQTDELRAKLRAAESGANLQAQRCSALEDRVAELEAALVGARDRRARAEAQAETAQREANDALDQLDALRGQGSGANPSLDPNFSEAFQAKLLQIERLSSERDALRRSSDEWRSKARVLRRERDESTLTSERTSSQLQELRERDAAAQRRIEELERLTSELKKALEIAERRAKHLREHFGATR